MATPGVQNITSYGEQLSDLFLPIGKPPVDLYFSNDVLDSSIPVMYARPGQGKFTAGLDLFEFSDRLTEFVNKMRADYDIDITPDNGAISIAFSPEAIPGIQISNDYGASFLQNLAEVASPTLGQLAQMTGSRELGTLITQGTKDISKAMGAEGAGRWLAGYMEAGGAMAKNIAEKVTPGGQIGDILRAGVKTAEAMLMGARVDFPKVWIGSMFSGPVTIPIRLYNPDQRSDVAYHKHIIDPLTTLLVMGAPLSDQDNLYRWPYIYKIWAPGIFKWEMASLNSITVQPGAENQMSWNQRPSMIDVRLEFQPLHQVMLNRRTSRTVPSVGDYVDQLRTGRIPPKLWSSDGKPNWTGVSTGIVSDEDLPTTTGTPTPTVDPDAYKDPGPRVPSDDETDAQWLKEEAARRGITEADLQRKLMEEELARIESDKLRKVREDEEALDFAQAESAQKAAADRALQEELQAADAMMGAYPQTGGEQGAYNTPGPEIADYDNQTAESNTQKPNTAYVQSTDGAPPDSDKNVPKETPEGGKKTGETNAFFSGVASKLDAAGTYVYGKGKEVATAVVDGATYKAKQWSDTIEKVTGKAKSTGDEIKSTITKTTTIDEERKADVIPTSTESEKKATVEPTVASEQSKQQNKSSEIAQENQSYVKQLNTWQELYNKTTDPATKTYAQTRINNLKNNHELNLAAIEARYA